MVGRGTSLRNSPTSLSCLNDSIDCNAHREGHRFVCFLDNKGDKTLGTVCAYCSPEPERCLRSSLIGVAALLCHMGTKSSFDLSISSLDIALTGNGDEIGLN